MWMVRCAWLALLFSTINAQAKTFTGLIYPLHDITMSAGVAGLVMKRMVAPGQYVKTDQVLLLLDDRLQTIESERRKVIYEDQSELMAARERTVILTTLLKDSRDVFKETGSISKDELLRLEAEYVASNGRLEQLVEQKKRERLDYESAERERLQRHITAPINGIVTKVIPQVGEWAKPGDPIILLVDASTAVLHVAVPYKEVGGLKVGTVQTIQLESGSSVTQTTGRVTFISPVADPASGLVEIKVTFNNPQLAIKPGIKGHIEIKSNVQNN
jgi:RND family efflux transporter MFP subunit